MPRLEIVSCLEIENYSTRAARLKPRTTRVAKEVSTLDGRVTSDQFQQHGSAGSQVSVIQASYRPVSPSFVSLYLP